MSINAACVLIIDDSDDQSFANELQAVGVEASVLHPEEIARDDVSRADVVLIDFRLDNWPGREKLPFSCQSLDGLALAGLLRRHVHDITGKSPTAFAIRTGRMVDLASPLPPDSRVQVLSRINNLEWIFEKAASTRLATSQVKLLAEAVRQLPEEWPLDNALAAQTHASDLLGLANDVDPALLNDVLDCCPPLHSMSQWSHGLSFLRWFLHRILPYPCFLLDNHYLAARLRISLAALAQVVESPHSPFGPAIYKGFLAEFLGTRWWRASVEQMIWKATDGDTLNGARLRAWLSTKVDATLEAAPDEYPVVCLDETHRPLERAYPMNQCVRLQPDDWPLYADQAWTTVALAQQHSDLAALVKVADRARVVQDDR
jgi:hypothetical protein